MRRILVAGNWKMHGSNAANEALLSALLAGRPSGKRPVDLLVCPPAVYLKAVADQLSGSDISVGAQNVSEHASGAYTGETSAAMLKDLGCEFVIVGHSERRSLYAESSALVAQKFAAVQSVGLIPILCVGETREQREAEETQKVIDEQLDAVFDSVGISSFGRAVIAYEPVWAIGTGLTASPEEAQDVHSHIRARLDALDSEVARELRILYGGSVKGDNAAGLFAQTDIDGGLVGGASLKADDFLAIAEAAAGI